MKRNVRQELRLKSASELSKLLAEARRELVKQKILIKARKFKNVAFVRGKKKEIAYILTIIKEKELTKL